MGLRQPRERVKFGQRYLLEKVHVALGFKYIRWIQASDTLHHVHTDFQILERLHWGPEFSHNYLIDYLRDCTIGFIIITPHNQIATGDVMKTYYIPRPSRSPLSISAHRQTAHALYWTLLGCAAWASWPGRDLHLLDWIGKSPLSPEYDLAKESVYHS